MMYLYMSFLNDPWVKRFSNPSYPGGDINDILRNSLAKSETPYDYVNNIVKGFKQGNDVGWSEGYADASKDYLATSRNQVFVSKKGHAIGFGDVGEILDHDISRPLLDEFVIQNDLKRNDEYNNHKNEYERRKKELNIDDDEVLLQDLGKRELELKESMKYEGTLNDLIESVSKEEANNRENIEKVDLLIKKLIDSEVFASLSKLKNPPSDMVKIKDMIEKNDIQNLKNENTELRKKLHKPKQGKLLGQNKTNENKQTNKLISIITNVVKNFDIIKRFEQENEKIRNLKENSDQIMNDLQIFTKKQHKEIEKKYRDEYAQLTLPYRKSRFTAYKEGEDPIFITDYFTIYNQNQIQRRLFNETKGNRVIDTITNLKKLRDKYIFSEDQLGIIKDYRTIKEPIKKLGDIIQPSTFNKSDYIFDSVLTRYGSKIAQDMKSEIDELIKKNKL